MARSGDPWWRDAVVYQIYPRSFQDSDGDGIGDLRGVTSRLDHLRWLGVDALWLSPFFPSGGADLGYDVSDFVGVDPAMGTLADVDELIRQAHDRGIRVLLDLVANHTSIEHPWFRAHPERYVWSDDGPPNNWVASFGGPAWTRDERTGRWYLHSFYPEQPDLDWSQPEVRDAIGEVARFWLERGVDGFRVDAVDRLAKDPQLRDDPPAGDPFGLPLPEEYAALEHVHSIDGPQIGEALAALRASAGDALLVGEVYLPSARLGRYLEHLDLVFAFEFLHAPRDASRLAEVIAAAGELDRVAWVLSNHDFPRLASRFGPAHARAAAMLLLTLPGSAFIYQGDELGMQNGPGALPPLDRHGRDGFRHPMQWEPTASGGFTDGVPWLEPIDPRDRSVAAQRDEPGSMLELYRALIALRRGLPREIGGIEAVGSTLSFARGDHTVAVNLGDDEAPGPGAEPLLSTSHEHRARPARRGRGRRRARLSRAPPECSSAPPPGRGFEPCHTGYKPERGDDQRGKMRRLGGLLATTLLAATRSRAAPAPTPAAARARSSASSSSTSPAAPTRRRPRSAPTSPAASTRSASSSCPRRPTPSASSSCAGSAPRTTRSTSSAWT